MLQINYVLFFNENDLKYLIFYLRFQFLGGLDFLGRGHGERTLSFKHNSASLVLLFHFASSHQTE
jgi:hypothetical protein